MRHKIFSTACALFASAGLVMGTLVASGIAPVSVAAATTGGTAPAPKTCRDAKGRFAKCPAVAPAEKPKRCRNAKGQFAKCGTPGAVPGR